MEKVRILTITTTGLEKKDGISTIILDNYKYFNKKKFELDIISFSKYSSELISEFEKIGVNVLYMPLRKNRPIKYIIDLIRLFISRKYDALYIHGSSAIMSMELIIAKICGCQTRIVHSHNTTCNHKKLDKLLRPLFYKSYTHALACSQKAGEWLFESRKFTVLKNGRNIDRYKFDNKKRIEMRKKFNLDDNVLVIGHVGNFNEQKNQEFIVRVCKELKIKKDNFKLFLMGSGRKEDCIKKLVESLNLSNNVMFLGNIDNVPDVLQAMDVMVLPSLYEGLPLVVIEWQIAGLPCLISDKVTEECSYTSLVNFKSLSDSFVSWADKIIELGKFNRSKVTENIELLTNINGYNIEENSLFLQKYLSKNII